MARGAAYYGLVRQGMGVRVGSGSPRTYYVSIGAPSQEAMLPAVCLVPRGTEEGFTARLDELDFEARTNEPVEFQLLASSTRTGDELGQIVDVPADQVTPLPPIRTVLRYGRKGEALTLPVTLRVHLTEVGTLAIFCDSRQSDHQWQLQFDVRQTAEVGNDGQHVEETLDQGAIDAATAVIRCVFTNGDDALPASSLRQELEESLALAKEHWPTSLIRNLADALLEVEPGRARSSEYEARWLNTLGFCLRPGFGDPVDEWRMKQAWKLFFAGPAFPRQADARMEWWIFWRRIGGGLNAGQQNELYQVVRPYLQPAKQRKKPRYHLPKHVSDGEMLEIWMLLANLERLPTEAKEQVGDALLLSASTDSLRTRELWSLSRLGARTPSYGPVDRVISGKRVAAWIRPTVAHDAAVERGNGSSLDVDGAQDKRPCARRAGRAVRCRGCQAGRFAQCGALAATLAGLVRVVAERGA